MPVFPFGSCKAILTKSPTYGNAERFSNGKAKVEVVAWEVWNSRITRQVSPQSKIYNDETTCVIRTHNQRAGELEPDDSVYFDGYDYSVQSIRPLKSSISIRSKIYEVELK